MILPRSFFRHSTIKMAKNLLGCVLVHDTKKGRIAGRIVETEAYLAKNDPACHASHGITRRNRTMFGPAGYSYVYCIYGIYNCFNVVTGPKGEGSAVLIRALEPLDGIDLMQKKRNTEKIDSLCSGPGKLCIAMGINKSHDNMNLQKGPIKLLSPNSYSSKGFSLNKNKIIKSIIKSKRIGISKGNNLELRFYIDKNPFISMK